MLTQENWKQNWRDVISEIERVQHNLISSAELNADYAYCQAIYTVASQINISAVELWIAIDKEKECEMSEIVYQDNTYKVEWDKPAISPPAFGGGARGRWEWLRQAILDAYHVNGEGRIRVTLKNKRDVRSAQATVQHLNYTEKDAKKGRRQLPPNVQLITRTRPIKDKDGEYELAVWLSDKPASK